MFACDSKAAWALHFIAATYLHLPSIYQLIDEQWSKWLWILKFQRPSWKGHFFSFPMRSRLADLPERGTEVGLLPQPPTVIRRSTPIPQLSCSRISISPFDGVQEFWSSSLSRCRISTSCTAWSQGCQGPLEAPQMTGSNSMSSGYCSLDEENDDSIFFTAKTTFLRQAQAKQREKVMLGKREEEQRVYGFGHHGNFLFLDDSRVLRKWGCRLEVSQVAPMMTQYSVLVCIFKLKKSGFGLLILFQGCFSNDGFDVLHVGKTLMVESLTWEQKLFYPNETSKLGKFPPPQCFLCVSEIC